MKKQLLFTMFFTLTTWWANAQISQGGTPPSFKYGINADVDRITLRPKDMKFIMAEEEKFSKSGLLYHIGYNLECDIDMNNSGTWTDLPDGSRIWQVQIKAPGALAQAIYYDKFHLPVGAKLFLYNEDKSQVLGAYTWYNNHESGVFANELVYGDLVNIEYYEPARVAGKLEFHIDHIGYIYRGVPIRKNPSWTDPSQSCEVNVNCSPVGDNWQDEKKGVARILIVTPQGQGWCSGSLINNTNQDCTPYMLTAWHCYENATASQLNQWVFYFNYESSTCQNPTTEPSSNTMVGCALKSAGSINGGSDFLLVQLNSNVPASYNPYMNGWDRSNTAPSNGVCIHHPSGSIKKISTYANSSTATWSGAASNAHWRVVWTQNANGWGVTEGGSSGSPLFNSNGLIVGTLTGGSSYCWAQSQPDYYGKMYYHWDQNGSTASSRLKDWLDPTNSGVTTLSGKNCGNTSTLNADFYASATTVLVGQNVTFTSTSSGNPTSYSWNFGSGASPATSTSPGPVTVSYSTTGLKTVSLTVSDGTTTDTETKTNYINVVTEISGCDTMHYPLPGTMTYYLSSNGGYVSGNNAYGDLAKADYFTGATNGWNISEVYIYFGHATGSSSQVPIKIWNDNGTNNSPGTVLGTVDVPISTIVSNVANNTPVLASFSSPVTIDGSFFVGVVLPTVAGDTVCIVTNTDGDVNPGTAWEQWSDNSWYAYNDPNSWGLNVQHAIWPIVCSPTTNIESSAANNKISMFPNPAYDKLNLYFGNYTGDVEISIYNLLGQLVMNENITVSPVKSTTLNISNLKAGMYLIQGKFGDKQFNDRIEIIR